SGNLSSPVESGLPPIVIGDALREIISAGIGDRVTIFSVRPDQVASAARRPHVKQFAVAGVFETSLDRYDEILVYVGIDEARDLLAYAPDEVSRFDVALADVTRADSVAAKLSDQLGFPV